MKIADRRLVWEYDQNDKEVHSHCVCICHTWRLRVDDVAYFSMRLDPEDEEFIILKKDQKDSVDKSTSELCDKDACMVISRDTDCSRTTSETSRHWMPYAHSGTPLWSNDLIVARITSRMADHSSFRCHVRWIGPHQEIISGYH